jgi:N-acetylglucosamine kinase-like BadF-type ATPase
MIYLGVDGGGTKTRFLALDDGGRVVLDLTLGSSYLPAVGKEGVKALLREAVAHLPEPPARAVLGLGGYGEVASWDEDYRKAVGEILPSYHLLNDVELAFLGAFGGEEGVLVLGGTGSMAYGRGPLGLGRAGGFGPLFGDEGSAYWIGIRALNLASRAEDGRDPPTRLQEIPRLLGKRDLLEVLAWLEEDPTLQRSRVASLAQIVDTLAPEDQAARGLLEQAAQELFHLGVTLARRLGTNRMAYTGGVFQSSFVREAFFRLASKEGIDLRSPLRGPAEQAALMARLGGDAGCV